VRGEWCLPEEMAKGKEEIKGTQRKPSVCQYLKKLRATFFLPLSSKYQDTNEPPVLLTRQ